MSTLQRKWRRGRNDAASWMAHGDYRLVRRGAMPELEEPDSPLQVWMDPIEYAQVVAIFEAIRPREVVEWGSGGSTRALLGRGTFVQRWITIEHDEAWCAKVRQTISDPRLELRHVAASEPEPPPADGDVARHEALLAWRARAETDRAIFAAYLDEPRRLGAKPQMILVDGRARCLCIEEGFDLLEPGGVLVLHDAHRPEYRAAMESVGGIFLAPWNQGQVALATKR